MLENLPILKEAAQVPGLLKEVYGDLAKPGVTQVGKALSTVLGLGNTILWPVTLLNEKAKMTLEKNLENYRDQLQSTPEENIIEVAPEVGVPVTEKLSYVTDEDLSSLYVNLLSKASTLETASLAHPSFVTVVNNLSPDEAVLLKEFTDKEAIPFVTAQLVTNSDQSWHLLADILTGLEISTKLSFPKNLVAYFSNLNGLGVFEIRRDLTFANNDMYENLEKQYRPSLEALKYNHDTHRVDFARGKIEVTPFGRLFINSCLSKLKESNTPVDTGAS